MSRLTTCPHGNPVELACVRCLQADYEHLARQYTQLCRELEAAKAEAGKKLVGESAAEPARTPELSKPRVSSKVAEQGGIMSVDRDEAVAANLDALKNMTRPGNVEAKVSEGEPRATFEPAPKTPIPVKLQGAKELDYELDPPDSVADAGVK